MGKALQFVYAKQNRFQYPLLQYQSAPKAAKHKYTLQKQSQNFENSRNV
jgi:hypothetical protein